MIYGYMTSGDFDSNSVQRADAVSETILIFVLVFNPLTPTVAIGTAIKHPVPDRVKPSFVILTSGHSDAHIYSRIS